MTQTVTDRDFATETNEESVLIDFWVTWCGPCRMRTPILEQLSEEYDRGKVKIVKMDVNENPAIPVSFGIMSILILLLKKDGEVVEKAVSVYTEDQSQAMIARRLQTLISHYE